MSRKYRVYTRISLFYRHKIYHYSCQFLHSVRIFKKFELKNVPFKYFHSSFYLNNWKYFFFSFAKLLLMHLPRPAPAPAISYPASAPAQAAAVELISQNFFSFWIVLTRKLENKRDFHSLAQVAQQAQFCLLCKADAQFLCLEADQKCRKIPEP